MTDTYLLNEEIDASGFKRSWIAKQLNLSCFGLKKKINNETQFKAEEIKILCRILKIVSLKRKEEIFFADDVDKMTTK